MRGACRWRGVLARALLLAATAAAVNASADTQLEAVSKQFDLRLESPYVFVADQIWAMVSFSDSAAQAPDFSILEHCRAIVLHSVVSREDKVWQIPSDIARSSALSFLLLDSVNIGTLPTEMGQLTALQFLFLYGQDVEGTVPSELALCTSLQGIYIQSTQLTGLPTQLANSPGFSYLRLLESAFDELPSEVGRLTHIENLSLHQNRFAGELPSQLGLLTAVTHLAAFENKWSGPLPSELGRWTNATLFDLRDNAFEGTVPSQLGRMSLLTSLDLSNNRLSGAIPSQLARLTALESFHAGNNTLSAIPTHVVASLRNLSSLQLPNNRLGLGGRLPTQLGVLSLLTELDLGYNGFVGTVPSQLAALQRLVHLRLGGNGGLGGSIPPQLGALALLESLELHGNDLDGTVPAQLALLTNLHTVLLDTNRLQGTLPAALVSLPSIARATVAHNRFHGVVDASASAAARAVWLEQCDESGLDHHECEYECAGCPSGAVRIRRCDWKGRNKACLAWHTLVALGVAVTVLLSLLLRRLKPEFHVAWLAVRVATGVWGVTESCVDIVFAVNATGAIRVLAWCVISLALCATAVLAGWTLTKTDNALPPLVRAVTWVVALGNISILRFVIPPDSPLNLTLAAVGLGESLMEGALQFVSLASGNLTALNYLALALSTASAVTTMLVVMILVVARPSHESKTSVAVAQIELAAAEPPADQDAQNEREKDASGEEEGPGGRGTSGRNAARASVFWCCCAVVAVAVGAGSRDRSISARVSVDEWAHVSLAPTATTQPQPWNARIGGLATAKQDAAQCDFSTLLSFGDFVVCLLGKPVVVYDLAYQVSSNQLASIFSEASDQVIVVTLQELKGSVPSEIGNLSGAGVLLLFFEEGDIPSQLGRMTSLVSFIVRSFSPFEIPSQIGLLAIMEYLYVQGQSALPSELGQVGALVSLELDNFVSLAAVPSELGLLTNLQSLRFQDSTVHAPLPSQLGLCTHLRDFTATGSELQGTLPTQFAQLARLTALRMAGTGLGGSLQDIFLSNATILHLELGGNDLVGTITSAIPATSPLKTLDLSDSLVSGTIPTQLGLATALVSLSLSRSALTGTIPTQLALLTALAHLDLSNSGVGGDLPRQLGALTALTTLWLHGLRLRGTVPSELARLSALAQVSVGDNALQGRLPSEFDLDQRELWLEACDYSGLHHAECKQDCPGCGLVSVKFRACDSTGRDPGCLPLYALSGLVVCVALSARVVLRSLVSRKVALRELVVPSLLSSVMTLHFAFCVLFALSVNGLLRALMCGFLGLVVISRLLFTSHQTIVRLQHSASAFHSVSHHYRQFCTAVLFCVMDPYMVSFLADTRPRGARSFANASWLARMAAWLSVFSAVPTLVLESVEVGNTGLVLAAQAVVVSVLALAVGARGFWGFGDESQEA